MAPRRQCESCGLALPDGKTRRRRDGKLLCGRCDAGGSGGVYGGRVEVEAAGDEPDITKWPPEKLMDAIAHERKFLEDAASSRGPIQYKRFEEAHGGRLVELLKEKNRRMEERRRNRPQSNKKLSHDQGDGAIINHCPFCGGGSIIGRGDGTAECQFCKTQTPGSGVFTVQVQPQHSGFPQTNPMTGEPINLPDTPGAPTPGPADPSNYDPPAEQYVAPGEDEEDIQGEEQPVKTDQSAAAETGKPWTAKKYFITQDGVALDEETYQRHLALHFARSPGKMIEQIGLRVGNQ